MRQLERTTMLVGLGAALFLASSIHAQQNVASSLICDQDSDIEQMAISECTTETGVDSLESVLIGQATGESMRKGMLISAKNMFWVGRTDESDLASLETTDTRLVKILLAGAVAIAVYGARKGQGFAVS
jgi:hypothetical protein